jgi:hypothetical protein
MTISGTVMAKVEAGLGVVRRMPRGELDGVRGRGIVKPSVTSTAAAGCSAACAAIARLPDAPTPGGMERILAPRRDAASSMLRRRGALGNPGSGLADSAETPMSGRDRSWLAGSAVGAVPAPFVAALPPTLFETAVAAGTLTTAQR